MTVMQTAEKKIGEDFEKLLSTSGGLRPPDPPPTGIYQRSCSNFIAQSKILLRLGAKYSDFFKDLTCVQDAFFASKHLTSYTCLSKTS